jgi:hypothetical protein
LAVNPRCTGQSQDIYDDGLPLLEVDHLNGHAGGGRDHPIKMVALCPDCHTIRTYGSTREELRTILLSEARARHDAWIDRSADGRTARTLPSDPHQVAGGLLGGRGDYQAPQVD